MQATQRYNVSVEKDTDYCLHKVKVSPFLENSLTQKDFRFFQKHLNDCSVCYSEFNLIKKLDQEIESLIPIRSLENDEKLEFEKELSQILGRHIKAKTKVKRGGLFQRIFGFA